MSSTGPEPPATDRDELLDRVYGRARRLWWRRQSVIAGAVALVLVAMAVPAALSGGGDDDRRVVASAPEVSTTLASETTVAPDDTTTTTAGPVASTSSTTLRRSGPAPAPTTTAPQPVCVRPEAVAHGGWYIAYYSSRAGDYDVWMVDLGGAERNLTAGREGSQREPAISERFEVAYVDDATDGTLHVMNTQGKDDRDLGLRVGAGGAPDWAPHKGWLAYTTGGALVRVANVDTRMSELVTEGSEPSFSPSGEWLAFSRGGEIWIVKLDGSGLRSLGPGSSPSWGAQCRIAFTHQGDIWTMESDGTGRTRVTSGPANDADPDWAPSGASIAFTSTRNGNLDIFTVAIDGTGLRQVTSDPGDELGPSWGMAGTP